jgi:hypothetical protein
MFNFRKRNTDYYSVVAKAVRMLDGGTGDMRQRLYERARRALLAEMNRAYPPLDQSDILTAQMSLELAIREVEAEAQREARAQPDLDTPSTAAHQAATKPPANQNGEQGRGALNKLWAQVFRRAGDGAQGRGKALSANSVGQSDDGQGRETWLTELLARASRKAENDDQDFAGPPG